jgi:hypothetical protein
MARRASRIGLCALLAGARTMSAKWFELPCRLCGQHFVEMKDLLFHRCPSAAGTATRRPRGPKHRGRKARPDVAWNPLDGSQPP